MKKVIVIHDATSHGGKVLSASSSVTVGDLTVALVNDRVSCPIHGDNLIVEGAASYTEDGKAVAVDGGQTACGARLMATQDEMEVD